MLSTHISGAACPVQVGDRQLLVSPLSDGDFDELTLWRQGQVVRMARASMPPMPTPPVLSKDDAAMNRAALAEYAAAKQQWEADRDESYRTAYAYAASIDFFSAARGGSLTEKAALIQVVWRVLRRKQMFSLDDARKLVESGEAEAVVEAWNLVQFGSPPKTEDPSKNPPSPEA